MTPTNERIEDFIEEISSKIRAKMAIERISQRELADISGISVNTINNVCRGKSTSLTNIAIIFISLDISL